MKYYSYKTPAEEKRKIKYDNFMKGAHKAAICVVVACVVYGGNFINDWYEKNVEKSASVIAKSFIHNKQDTTTQHHPLKVTFNAPVAQPHVK